MGDEEFRAPDGRVLQFHTRPHLNPNCSGRRGSGEELQRLELHLSRVVGLARR